MRIAFLAHFYPPAACGGAGYYTASLAEGFHKAGAEVGVLCVDQWGKGRRYFNGYVDDESDGVPVRRLHVNWSKAPRPLDWLYDSPVIGEQAQAYLEQFQPDVVHVSSCYTLSASPVFVAKSMDFPVVMNLHDYWVICARHILLHKDNRVCAGPKSAWSCQKCLLSGTKAWRLTRLLAESTRQSLYEKLAEISWFTRQSGLRGMLGNLDRRRQVTLAAVAAADVLITPTNFARTLLESNGVPQGRIVVMHYGNRTEWAEKLEQVPSKHLRIGFLGNVMPIKGVHLLIEAYQQLATSNRIQLQIWGDTSPEPAYYQSLRESAPPGILWGGRYGRDDLARILGDLDVIVVPSIWYETQGIVIQEAFAAGLPVIVSDNTSMTETVTHNQNGLHFRRGSVDDLVCQIRRLLDEPGLLERLASGISPVRTIDQDIAQLGAVYADLIGQGSG